MDLDGKKLATSNLPYQVIKGLIRTQNKNYFSNPVGPQKNLNLMQGFKSDILPKVKNC